MDELFEQYNKLEIEKNNKTTHDLEIENQILFEIAKTSLLYIRAQKIAESDIPNGSGVPVIDVNQKILEKAYNDYCVQHNEEPNEPLWLEWLERPEYNPIEEYVVAARTQFARTKNGWGKEKVRKDLARFKSIEYQTIKYLKKLHGMN